MRITHISAENFLGARDINIALTQPVLLLAGANGAGKSSITNAIALALNADLGRVALKKEAAQLVTEGAASARVKIEVEGDTFEVHIGKGGKITDHSAGRTPPPALPFVLDSSLFARTPVADRRTLLFGLMGVQLSPASISERLVRRGLEAARIEAVTPHLRSGFAAAEKHAREQASQARGAWKVATGETYGEKKAEGWQPPAVEPVERSVTIEDADAKVREFDQLIGDLQQAVGAARATHTAAADRATRIDRLRDQVAMLERIKGRLATAEENVTACRASLSAAGGEDPKAPGSYLLRGLASVTADFLMIAGAVPIDAGLTSRAKQHLAEYRKLHGDPNAEPVDPVRIAEIQRGLQTAESGAANARRDLAAAEAAAVELAALEASPVEVQPVTDIESRLADAQRHRAEWSDYVRACREDLEADARREKIARAAAQHHADVIAWGAIADALAPGGIPGEILAAALDPFNDRLAANADVAQWPVPRLDADMAITVNGRPFGLLSESERWRTDALLTVSLAQVSGLRFVVLDRFDCLDLVGREDLLCWLSELAQGEIDTAIVLGTLKSAPAADKLPAGIEAQWIERGTLIPASPQHKEAA